jgi:hypothetical protein
MNNLLWSHTYRYSYTHGSYLSKLQSKLLHYALLWNQKHYVVTCSKVTWHMKVWALILHQAFSIGVHNVNWMVNMFSYTSNTKCLWTYTDMNFLPYFGVENSPLNLLKHFRYTLYPGSTTVPCFERLSFYNLPAVTNPFLHLIQCFSIHLDTNTHIHTCCSTLQRKPKWILDRKKNENNLNIK